MATETMSTPGTKEGETCNRDGCEGQIAFTAPEDCSCHLYAPCSFCLDVRLHCPECDWHEGVEEGR